MSRPNHRMIGKTLADREDYDGTEASYDISGVSWADLVPLQGRELMHARQVHSLVTHKTRMPYQDWITSEIVWTCGDREFETISVTNHNEKHRWCDVLLVERV